MRNQLIEHAAITGLVRDAKGIDYINTIKTMPMMVILDLRIPIWGNKRINKVLDLWGGKFMKMDHRNFGNIVEIHQEVSPKEVNRYLALGWILLNVHTTDYGHPVERHQNTEFTLGWNKENGEVQKPQKEKSQIDDFISAWELKNSDEN
ncbi:hypothetical protein NSU08_02935 [Paenibacillus sp. FSL H7-0331]|uniref:hypothetical protein n=1 Tax=Paenibacillus sp. FSL H7-0331 TaxID=1920421 RepID=UPI0030F88CA8